MKYLSLILLSGCHDPDAGIKMESGTYTILDYSNDPVLEEYAEEIENLVFTVDMEESTVTITGTSSEITLSFVRRQEDEDMCPTMFSATSVHAYTFEESFELFGVEHHNVYMHANHCTDNEPITDIEIHHTLQEDSSQTYTYILRKPE